MHCNKSLTRMSWRLNRVGAWVMGTRRGLNIAGELTELGATVAELETRTVPQSVLHHIRSPFRRWVLRWQKRKRLHSSWRAPQDA